MFYIYLLTIYLFILIRIHSFIYQWYTYSLLLNYEINGVIYLFIIELFIDLLRPFFFFLIIIDY